MRYFEKQGLKTDKIFKALGSVITSKSKKLIKLEKLDARAKKFRTKFLRFQGVSEKEIAKANKIVPWKLKDAWKAQKIKDIKAGKIAAGGIVGVGVGVPGSILAFSDTGHTAASHGRKKK